MSTSDFPGDAAGVSTTGKAPANANEIAAIWNTPEAAREIQRSLPHILVTILERRYLANLQPEGCAIFPRPGDQALPLLREIEKLGRPETERSWAEVLPSVLTACHDPGHALVTVLHGDGERHRLYIGVRRLVGLGAGSTEDFACTVEGAYKAGLSGLQTGPSLRMDERSMPALAETLQSAMSLAVLTGIPGGSDGFALSSRSLDRLVKSVGTHRYALMIVAEPVAPAVLDETIDICRSLKSDIHRYVRATKSHNKGGSEQIAHTDKEATAQPTSSMPATLVGMAVFFELAGHLIPGATALAGALGAAMAGLAQPLMGVATMARLQESQDMHTRSQQVSEGRNWSQGDSMELLNANAEACENLLQQYINRLEVGRSSGWWQTAIYIAAHSDAALQSVSGAMRSLCNGSNSKTEPIRTLTLPTHLLRVAVTHGQILRLLPASGRQGHPLGATFDALATCINADELAILMNLPQKEIPGLPMRDMGEFALTVPPPTPDSITLGYLQDSVGRDLSPVSLTSKTLNRHVFVTGMPGYGKTNTCMQILLESYSHLQIPFLVLEPAKTEYRCLQSVAGLSKRLNVYTLGSDTGRPFRLNPLAPLPGIPLGRHIDLLKAVFNASFPMYAGMPYVLEEAILEVFAERGWSLYTSENDFLTERSTDDERAALTPCLEDLHDKIEVVLKRKSYGQEIHMNMGAALRSRLHSMMVGNKGMVFNTRRSTPPQELFQSPTVIELQNLGDDEEKAFVMALLFVLLYEYAEVRQKDVPRERRETLQHITLIEEAHRLLTATHGASKADIGDPRGKAVTMFTDMLAEMRAYGEGFIIADQIPTKLAPETLKNTNLKIVHRLAAPDDREVVGQCLNLTPAQIKYVNNLVEGLAVVHDERIGEAVLTRVIPVKSALFSQANESLPVLLPGARTYLHRHAGCHSCPSPCDFYPRLVEAQTAKQVYSGMKPLMEALLLEASESRQGASENPPQAWRIWHDWRFEWERDAPIMRNSSALTRPGLTFCAVLQASHDWLGNYLLARGPQRPETTLAPQDRLARERALKAVGVLIRDWQVRDTWDLKAQTLWERSTKEICDAVAAEPPFTLVGCVECPARCRLLAFVNPHLTRLEKSVRPRLNEVTAADEGMRALQQALASERAIYPAPTVDSPILRSHWMYCMLVNMGSGSNMSPAMQAIREQMLHRLRHSTPSNA